MNPRVKRMMRSQSSRKVMFGVFRSPGDFHPAVKYQRRSSCFSMPSKCFLWWPLSVAILFPVCLSGTLLFYTRGCFSYFLRVCRVGVLSFSKRLPESTLQYDRFLFRVPFLDQNEDQIWQRTGDVCSLQSEDLALQNAFPRGKNFSFTES